MNSSRESDGDLVNRFRGGSQDAAIVLYERYALRLHQLAQTWIGEDLQRRFDSEDVAQSVFRTFFRRAANGEYDVPQGEELWALFLVIALNKLRSLAAHHRAAKRSVSATSSLDRVTPAAESEQGQGEAYRQLRSLVDEQLSQMTPANRQIVELRIAGCSMDEIAETTQRSKRTVERVAQDFRRKLQALIHGD